MKSLQIVFTVFLITSILFSSLCLVKAIPDDFAFDDWVMRLEDTSAVAGAQNHIIPIQGTWYDSIVRYAFSVNGFTTSITDIDVTLAGTIFEGNGSLSYTLNPPEEPEYANIVFSANQGFEFTGDSGILCYLSVDINQSALATTLPLSIESSEYNEAGYYQTYEWINPQLDYAIEGNLTILQDNLAPSTPTQPEGPDEGETNIAYTYGTSATDPEGDELEYWYDWGDGTNSGWLYKPTKSHRWTGEGVYVVRVKARDIHGYESPWSPPKLITITSPANPLETFAIQVETSIAEGSVFTVTVTNKDTQQPVHNAEVGFTSFSEEVVLTDTNGQVSIEAPFVTKTKLFTLTVTKDEYQPYSQQVLIVNQEIQEPQAWFYGVITDEQGTILPDAKICVTNVESDEEIISCSFAQEENSYIYQIQVEPGTYQFEITASGYATETKQTTILENTAVEHNFILASIEPSDVPDETSSSNLVEYVVNEKVEEGIIGASVRVNNQGFRKIFYADDLSIESVLSSNKIELMVSGEETTPGTIIVVKIDEELFSSTEVHLLYDNQEIIQTYDFEQFFTPNSTDPQWMQVSTETESYIFVSIPHFSTHTITITPQVIVNTLALISVYAIVIILVGVVAGAPVLRLWKKIE